MFQKFLISSIVLLSIFVIFAQSQPVAEYITLDNTPYLMNLLKRTNIYFPSGNHDAMIKGILKSRRY
ncbi:unnamed protein product [Caenorhabditis angaria]|uniref:Uncharacterized protein n=1 Tax=Caenorhabditis angaria TaxID=860376 RepID=A0A9P1IC28_9PELO|nr:unnamed protein product [Caenorhabditis angaria]